MAEDLEQTIRDAGLVHLRALTSLEELDLLADFGKISAKRLCNCFMPR